MLFDKIWLFPAAALLFLSVAAASAQTPTGFAGSDKCAACHDEISKAFDKNPHHVVETDKHRGHAGFACEACHGPSAKHTDSLAASDIVNPAKLSTDGQNKLCLACHRNEMTPVGPIAGGHAKDEGPGCVGCHSIHGTDKRPLVVHRAPDVNKLCAACHQSVWADFQRPFKHRLPEGAMSCVDCHNPHGSGSQTQRVAFANEPGCLRCHSEMRGPFTYEHAPVRLEGCAGCHEPHGSANPRMLIRHEVRFVCLECHSNLVTNPPPAGHQVLGGTPPAFHDLRSPRYQNCTVCHVKIHGSYVDGTLLR